MVIMIWLFVTVLGITILYYLWFNKAINAPPGPTKWPLIGNIFEIYFADSSYPHLAFQKLADKYGEVMSINLGIHKMVMISSFDLMRSVMKLPEMAAARYGLPIAFDRAHGHDLGIIFGRGENWSVLRRFTVASLREFGFAKKSAMETSMILEVGDLLKTMKQEIEENNGILTFHDFFGISVINLLWVSVTGQRFSSTDKRARRMLELNAQHSLDNSIDRVSILLPFLGKIFPGMTGVKRRREVIKALQDFTKEMIAEAKSTFSPEEKPKNFIDSFLHQIEKKEHPAFNEKELMVILMDLFLGGSETTSNMLSYAMLYMALNPEVQKRVQDEIDEMIGQATLSLDDIKSMPYTQATILEIFRMALIIPIPFGREAIADFEINGYHISKGTMVAYNLYSAQMDPEFWKDPEVFRPDRFLTPRLTIVNDDRVPLFGFGKRICLGEPLARNAFFMYFTSILRYFELSAIPGQTPTQVISRPNTNTQLPLPYSVFVKERKPLPL